MRQKVTVFKYHLLLAKKEVVYSIFGNKDNIFKKHSPLQILWNKSGKSVYYITAASNYLPSSRILSEEEAQGLIDMNINVDVIFMDLKTMSKKEIYMTYDDVLALKKIGMTNWEDANEFSMKAEKGVYNVHI